MSPYSLKELNKVPNHELTQAEVMMKLGAAKTRKQYDSLVDSARKEKQATAAMVRKLRQQERWSESVVVLGHEIRTENTLDEAYKRGYNPSILKRFF